MAVLLTCLDQGVRSCIFLETDRADGPEVSTRAPNGVPGPIVQFGSFNLSAELDEETAVDMYAKIRCPLMVKMTGSVATRKLVSVHGWARHGILYEFVSLEAVQKKITGQLKLKPNWELWKNRLIRNLIHTPGSPALEMRIWPPVS